MNIFIFGISNVGKTTVGSLLAAQLGFRVFDMDQLIKQTYKTTIYDFVRTGTLEERDKKRGSVLKKIVYNEKGNKVIIISPMFYSQYYEHAIHYEKDSISVELRDTPRHIFQRLVFLDKNDKIYRDEEYKKKFELDYLNDIQEDINTYSKIYGKYVDIVYNMDGKKPGECVSDVIKLLKQYRAKMKAQTKWYLNHSLPFDSLFPFPLVFWYNSYI